MTEKRKLIEVALPLEAINREASREKSIRHGHPSTLHLWWSRKPLAAARAVLFAQLVDDPSSRPEEFPTAEAQDAERQRLFDIIERLVPWEASNDEKVLAEARSEISKSCDGNPPPILDPFCGGGTIPLEAQRLGLKAHASDLNPVAVLITKALIEIPPKFAGMPPVNPFDRDSRVEGGWKGAEGLAADVRYYGKWMRDEAERRIGHLYPKAKLPGGGEATVAAWIWVRNVRCPNPACGLFMPLANKFWLRTKKDKEAYVVPRVEDMRVRFEIGHDPSLGPREGTVDRNGATCIGCGSAVPLSYVRAEGKAGRIGAQLMAIVAEGQRQRIYLPPTDEHEKAAQIAHPARLPETELPEHALGFRVQGYGMVRHADLFTSRQLTALSTFSNLVTEARKCALEDLGEWKGANDYADALATYLACGLSRAADYWSLLAVWAASGEFISHVFGRQALSMVWEFPEGAPLASSSGNWAGAIDWVARVVAQLPTKGAGHVWQSNVTEALGRGGNVISTDPPYYDNVGYADLADFFYVWLRRPLQSVYPHLFATVLTPKSQELVADPFRRGGKREAQRYFESGFEQVFNRMRKTVPDGYPTTVFYAFKQTEEGELGTSSTGWETLLEGMLRAGWMVTATWPMRTERSGRLRETGSNALASSIVLACRPRPDDAGTTDRRGFVNALRSKLPGALRDLQQGAIAPVDLAQAAIGPGMSVFSACARVVEPSGESMQVRTALGLINQVLDEVLAEQEGEFDGATRWAVKWFEQYGYNDGPFGTAEVLAKAQAVAVGALERQGIVRSRAGKVALLGHQDMPGNWDPATDPTLTAWEVVHQLIRRLDDAGEDAAGVLLRQVGGLGEVARDLAYRLYVVADRKGWSTSAQAFNRLVTSWRDVVHVAEQTPVPAGPTQQAFQL